MKSLQQIEKELRDIIVEAVPEIVELKFGCRFTTGETFIATDENGDSHFMDLPDANGDSEVYLVEDYGDDRDGIIGRPITLADVLLAIKKRRHTIIIQDCENNDYMEAKIFMDVRPYVWFRWDLTQDLDGQKEEAKRFIHGVICK